MAFSQGRFARLLIGDVATPAAWDMSAYFREAGVQKQVDMLDTTAFQAAAKSFQVGLSDARIQLQGLYDGSSNAVDQVLQARVDSGASLLIGYSPEGAGHLARMRGMSTKSASLQVQSSVTDMNRISADFVGENKGAEAGFCLSDPTVARTATGNITPALDSGAASSNGGAYYLWVVSSTTNASATVKLTHSTDNTTFTDISGATFTFAAGVTYANRVEFSGTVNRYVRAAVTYSGTGSFYCAVLFVRY